MDRGPLMKEEIDEGAHFVGELNKTFPIKAAFWAKASDEDYRYLYLAPDAITDGTRDAYVEVVRLNRQFDWPHLDMFRVKAIKGSDPRAEAVAEINRQYPSRTPSRSGGRMLGDMFVDLYVYPSPLPTAIS
jgi:hypothetical protein